MLKNGSSSRTIWRCLSLLYLVLSGTTIAQTVQNCPSHVAIAPCICSVKKLGLDIICEFTDHTHISKAMDVLKGQPNTVIFYLKLRHNTLPKLQGFVFLGLIVQHLTIHNSSLAVVEESSLSSIGKGLTQLDLSQNSLISVPSSSLANLHNLLILNFNHNKIYDLRARSFAGLDTLEILNLYGNKISNIDRDAFTGLDDRKLKRLNLGGNLLTSVPTVALSSLDVLKKLEMQENKITLIKEGDFEGLKMLDSLVMAHNLLREVPARVFSHLTQLNSLELDGNLITHVDPDAFIGLEENLQYLRLGENNLHSVPSDALRRLHRLRHLDLRSNNITYLPEDAFTGYGDSITFLNLQKNLIKVLPPMIFENLNSLETLNLQNNKLVHISEDITDTIVDTLRMIDITGCSKRCNETWPKSVSLRLGEDSHKLVSIVGLLISYLGNDNPLICDCDLRWFSMWLQNLRDKDDETMSKKRTVCLMVSEHREYSVQHIPVDRMGCVGKNAGRISGSAPVSNSPLTILQFFLIVGIAAHL